VIVEFEGEDGRRRTFDLGQCPLPGWHLRLAEALAQRIGPGGGLRTSASTIAACRPLCQFLRFLADRLDSPTVPAELTVEHVEAFWTERIRRVGPGYGQRNLEELSRLLRLPPLAGQVRAEVHDVLRRRTRAIPTQAKAGYTGGELRRLITTARADVARLRTRIEAAEALLGRWREAPDTLTAVEQDRAHRLNAMVEHGVEPAAGWGRGVAQDGQTQAEQLFVTRRDVPAMLVLLVAVTGRNIETIKELPAEHRVLDGQAVQLRLTKRRRGPRRWSEAVTWEIGRPGRELHHPGGLYLLLFRLMARSRALTEDPTSFWAFWRHARRSSTSTANDHGNPFRASLTAGIDARIWGEQHGLLDDAGQPLRIEFNRLKTSIEVRRTRRMGGHLPSAARTNTVPVLFRNYLRNDPTTIEWAHQVAGDALVDAEQAALAAHRQLLAEHSGSMTVLTQTEPPTAASTTAPDHAGGYRDGAWSSCRDSTQHPATGQPCRASFLDCFHCGNCVITTEHLPRLLALLTALATRRGQLSEQDWWARYGPAWVAIRHDVLTKFTPAQLEQARRDPLPDALLDLVEHPWEHP
jgi:hypothetical protein